MRAPLAAAVTALSVLVAAQASAQTRVYTNADLARPLDRSRTPSADDLASMAARQFVAPPIVPDGPTVTVFGGDPTEGPFGPLHQSAGRPLDPFWRPAAIWGYGYGFGGARRSSSDRAAGRVRGGEPQQVRRHDRVSRGAGPTAPVMSAPANSTSRGAGAGLAPVRRVR
ncbi:MAG: hypothetical protein R2712_08025 [Vicinamibacterales bacterium]